jgi:hypothetical protein
LASDKRVKGSDKIIFKPKPMRDFFFFKMIKASQRTLLHKIQVATSAALPHQVLPFASTTCAKQSYRASCALADKW